MTIEQLRYYINVTGEVVVLFDTFLFYALWNVFYHSAKEKITIIAGAVLVSVSAILSIAFDVTGFIRWIVCTALVIAYSFVRYEKHCEKAVFAVILFYSMRCIGWLFSNSISQMISNYNINRLIEKERPTESLLLNAYISSLMFFAIYILSFIFMLLIINRIFNGHENTAQTELYVSWYDVGFLSVFNVISILFVGIVAKLNVVPLEKDTFVLFENRADLYWKLPLLSVLLFTGEIISIIVFQKYRELKEQEKLYLAEKLQMKAMKLRLEEAEGFYDGIRSVKHEMKNHLANIKSLASDKKYEEVENYISKLDVSMEKLDFKISTGNALTDVIINDKCRQAENAGIKFDVQFSYDDVTGIDVFDFGIILNNLLDNAITACENVKQGEKFINLSMRHKKKFVILEVENSFSGVVIFSEDGMPATTKNTSAPRIVMEHGVGLKNVKEIAERYLGTLEIKVDGNIFKTTVLMQEKDK